MQQESYRLSKMPGPICTKLVSMAPIDALWHNPPPLANGATCGVPCATRSVLFPAAQHYKKEFCQPGPASANSRPLWQGIPYLY